MHASKASTRICRTTPTSHSVIRQHFMINIVGVALRGHPSVDFEHDARYADFVIR